MSAWVVFIGKILVLPPNRRSLAQNAILCQAGLFVGFAMHEFPIRLPLIQVPPIQTSAMIQEFKKVEKDEIQDV